MRVYWDPTTYEPGKSAKWSNSIARAKKTLTLGILGVGIPLVSVPLLLYWGITTTRNITNNIDLSALFSAFLSMIVLLIGLILGVIALVAGRTREAPEDERSWRFRLAGRCLGCFAIVGSIVSALVIVLAWPNNL